MKKAIIHVDWDKNYSAAPANYSVACIVTGKTLDEVKQRMMFSLSKHLSDMSEDKEEIPDEFSGEFELEYQLSVRAMLHHTEGIVPRKALSHVTGINLQQLSHYASGWRTPRPKMQRRIMDGMSEIGKQLLVVSTGTNFPN